jgi:hypothetical protein
MNVQVYQKFLNLASALSPEDLSCDGELPASYVRARYRQLMAEWRKLEKQVGRKVSEDEIWEMFIQRQATGVVE